jgi:glycosyltransferase involved in cell wall biosynthesis
MPMKLSQLPQSKLSVVAIPAHDEATYITDCLAALALQRDRAGAPIAQGSLEILVFANNCTDQTASVARQASQSIPHPITVVEENMPAGQLNAGWARKRAMDLAAMRLAEVAPIHGLILTTDADSRVAPTWLEATLHEFRKGADCVAGYIDANPSEYIGLGGKFLNRGRLEDTYLGTSPKSTHGAIRGRTILGLTTVFRPERAWPSVLRHIRQSAACRRALSAKIRR